MRGIHHQPEPERQTDLADVEGPARTLTDRERLGELAELTGLNKEELLRRAQFDDSGHLTRLNLYRTDVKDVSPLGGCKELTELYLDRTDVKDISPLAGCTKLEYLYLSGNWVRDISPLAGLTALTYLNLGGTNVRDISALNTTLSFEP